MIKFQVKLGVNLFIFFLFCTSVQSQKVHYSLQNDFNRALHTLGPEASVAGLCVNLSNSDTLWKYHEKQLLIPASVLKLVTTSTALQIQGADFRYHTDVYYDGVVRDSVLNGSLIIHGGGDPTFGSLEVGDNQPQKVLSRIYSTLKTSGVKQVSGDIVVIDDYFADTNIPSSRLWEDIGNYYGARPSGLTYRDNSVDIYLESPAVAGKRCRVVETFPKLDDITFDCKVLSSTTNRDSAYVYGVDGLNKWLIQGSIPVGQKRFKIKAALTNPEKAFANELKSYLLRQGIVVNGNVVVQQSDRQLLSKPVLTIYSPLLSEIVAEVNIHSNNLFADHLFLTLGKQMFDKPDWDQSKIVVSRYWKPLVNTDEPLLFLDGSGVSPKNVISPLVITSMLSYMSKQQAFPKFYNSMAIGGVRGTIKNLWTAENVKGKVHAKSGSFSGVVAYAGYFYNQSAQLCAFAIIVNNSLLPGRNIRSVIESLVSASVCHP
jgi:D-alanyl-D-alanine carboxypeptidase/D-alanyl-D-alanine-endopeptidase (penicillin-binding protein 4)